MTRARRNTRYALSPEERAERISAARQQLLEGVDKLMTADGWQQLITSRAWLRRYSLNNIIMILQQCPEATDVRPLSEWKALGYELMRKGTHKIKIWKLRYGQQHDLEPRPRHRLPRRGHLHRRLAS